MINSNLQTSFKLIIPLLALILLFSCKQNSTTFTASEAASVKDSVQLLAANTAKDISTKGPIAWLDYFEDASDFFMASNGDMAFADYKTADLFIKNTLVKQIPHINLKWSNIRIDPLTPQIAIIGANFHEDITDSLGKVTPFDGYFTAAAHQTAKGWKYRNAHWSIKDGK
jgi:hypothetical protein